MTQTYPSNASPNFRSGNLVQGQPLGATSATVSLSANNQLVNFNPFRDTPMLDLIYLQSNDTTATNRVFTIPNGQLVGQTLAFTFEAGSSYTCKLANSGNCKLSTDWVPVQYQSLQLQWDGQYWVEQVRSPTSVAVTVPGSQIITGSLNTAGVIAMYVTPVSVIAAPGAGVYVVVDWAEMYYKKSTAWTSGGDVQLQYATSPTPIILWDSTLLTGGASVHTLVTPTFYNLDASTGTSTGTATYANQAVQLTNLTQAFATGTGSVLEYAVGYHLVTLQA